MFSFDFRLIFAVLALLIGWLSFNGDLQLPGADKATAKPLAPADSMAIPPIVEPPEIIVLGVEG